MTIRKIHLLVSIASATFTFLVFLQLTGNSTATAQSNLNVCLQDDSDGHSIQFSSMTGVYRFTENIANGLVVTGNGTISRKGSVLTLQDNRPDRRVRAIIDNSVNKGNGSIQLLSAGKTFSILDRNTTNNECPSDGPDENEHESPSPAQVNLLGVSETTFNPINAIVRFQIVGESLSSSADDVTILQNERAISSSSVNVSLNEIAVSSVLSEGRNHLILIAKDSQDRLIYKEVVLWSGNRSINVTILDENNQLITGATVIAKLGDDQTVLSAASSNNGMVVFNNLPDRTIIFEASASENRFTTVATTGGADAIQLKLLAFNKPSSIDNNDFHLGTDGWEIGNAPVQIVPHQEALNAVSQSPAIHNDLVPGTTDEGPQSISRTFQIKEGTKSISVRYRFITSEIPGGFCGTRFNDYFNVLYGALQRVGRHRKAIVCMNGLGCGAFDSQGRTAWREISLPVDQSANRLSGDSIQVDITVANVGDGAFDSQVVVDFVDEEKLTIKTLALKDIDNTPLTFLSTDAHPYFGMQTRIHGVITVTGATDDSLQSLVLQVIDGGNVVATANLSQAARSILIQPFGDDGKVEITSSQLLFELPSSEASNVNTSSNGVVQLRAKAVSANGEEVTKNVGGVQKLARYTANNRYSTDRDLDQGGDDWIKPSVKPVIEHFSGINWNDFSNMNAGSFAPDHTSHTTGNDVDGHFSGYNARNAATAATIISHLNNPTFGSRISIVYVTFEKSSTNVFWNAIKDVTLNDGRQASKVILPYSGHATHFHWRVRD